MYAFIKALLRFVFSIAFNLKYEGRSELPKDTSFILASNHRSYADPPLVGAGARGKHAFMAKEELFKNKAFAWLISSLGAFPVSRGKGDTKVIDTAVERLENGRSLIIFPEGTRSKDGKVQRGKGGAGLIAVRSGKPIIPVGVVYGEKLRFRTRVTIKYGKPIYPQDYCEICDKPNPRQLAKLKSTYREEIKKLVEGQSTAEINSEDTEIEEN